MFTNAEVIDKLFGNDCIRFLGRDSWHKVYLPHVAQLWETPLDLDDGSAMLLSDIRYLLGQEDNKP